MFRLVYEMQVDAAQLGVCVCVCKKSFYQQFTQISLQLTPKGTRGKINSLSSQFELCPQVNSVLLFLITDGIFV